MIPHTSGPRKSLAHRSWDDPRINQIEKNPSGPSVRALRYLDKLGRAREKFFSLAPVLGHPSIDWRGHLQQQLQAMGLQNRRNNGRVLYTTEKEFVIHNATSIRVLKRCTYLKEIYPCHLFCVCFKSLLFVPLSFTICFAAPWSFEQKKQTHRGKKKLLEDKMPFESMKKQLFAQPCSIKRRLTKRQEICLMSTTGKQYEIELALENALYTATTTYDDAYICRKEKSFFHIHLSALCKCIHMINVSFW